MISHWSANPKIGVNRFLVNKKFSVFVFFICCRCLLSSLKSYPKNRSFNPLADDKSFYNRDTVWRPSTFSIFFPDFVSSFTSLKRALWPIFFEQINLPPFLVVVKMCYPKLSNLLTTLWERYVSSQGICIFKNLLILSCESIRIGEHLQKTDLWISFVEFLVFLKMNIVFICMKTVLLENLTPKWTIFINVFSFVAQVIHVRYFLMFRLVYLVFL